MPRLPLEGLLVADFTRVLAGPLCTQMLGDHGARVIKVEDPRGGDETRRWGPPFLDGISTYFLAVNRNKESLALDLKSDAGRKLARALIRRADVVVDNFLPAQRQELLGDVRRLNRRAIHCSISGFDGDTADAGTPGYDLLAQAGSGLMAITGDAAGEPVKVGVALADVLTAHHAFGAIGSALYARERDGRGARVEVSLFGSTLASLVNVAQAALATGVEASRLGNAHASIVPYQLFHASDRAFAIGVGTDRHFVALCRVLERPELAARFPTNTSRVEQRGTLVPLLDALFRTKTAHEWVTRLRAEGVPVSLVQGVLEALRGEPGRVLLANVEHPLLGSYETVLNPVRVDGARFLIRRPPPSLGEHTEAIVTELRASPASETGSRRGRRTPAARR
ncbi:MAG TPA: CoA transferase [Thermoanaerobaculia bacterium]|jgi:crotonobetainyl-CoA:carnitine CoA-transferase CaiB-like acyl-CoA transferase